MVNIKLPLYFTTAAATAVLGYKLGLGNVGYKALIQAIEKPKVEVSAVKVPGTPTPTPVSPTIPYDELLIVDRIYVDDEADIHGRERKDPVRIIAHANGKKYEIVISDQNRKETAEILTSPPIRETDRIRIRRGAERNLRPVSIRDGVLGYPVMAEIKDDRLVIYAEPDYVHWVTRKGTELEGFRSDPDKPVGKITPKGIFNAATGERIKVGSLLDEMTPAECIYAVERLKTLEGGLNDLEGDINVLQDDYRQLENKTNKDTRAIRGKLNKHKTELQKNSERIGELGKDINGFKASYNRHRHQPGCGNVVPQAPKKPLRIRNDCSRGN